MALSQVIAAEEQERLRRIMEDYGPGEAADPDQSKKDLEGAIAMEEEERLRRVEMLQHSDTSLKWTAEPFNGN